MIKSILQLNFPVIDLDSYRGAFPKDAKFKQSIMEYATQEANQYLEIDSQRQ